MPRNLRDLGSQAGGQAWAPVVGAPSPNRWTNREPQTPGNISWSEASRRSSSRHQDPALSSCLQTLVLDVSGQTTSKAGIQHHPSENNFETWELSWMNWLWFSLHFSFASFSPNLFCILDWSLNIVFTVLLPPFPQNEPMGLFTAVRYCTKSNLISLWFIAGPQPLADFIFSVIFSITFLSPKPFASVDSWLVSFWLPEHLIFCSFAYPTFTCPLFKTSWVLWVTPNNLSFCIS